MQTNKKYWIKKICDIYDFVLNYETEEIVLIYQELKKKSLNEVIEFYYKLVDRI